MKILIKLVKINLLTFFDLHKVVNAKTKAELKKVIPSFLLYIMAFGILAWSVYFYAESMLTGLNELNLGYLLPVAMMAITSAYLLFSTIFKVYKTVFDAKDYSILLGLPIKKSIIITSKLLILYISNLIYASVFMIPTYLAYVMGSHVPWDIHLLFWLSLIFIPAIPTVIGAIIGSLMTAIVANFKYKALVNIILGLGLTIGVMALSFLSSGSAEAQYANFGNSLVTKVNNIYPLTGVYLNIFHNGSVISLIFFIGASVLAFWLFGVILVRFFDKINSKLSAVTISKKYGVTKLKTSSALKALYKKELKKYFSSTIYVLNTAIFSAMFIIGLVIMTVSGSDQLETLLNIPGIGEMLTLYAPLIFGVICAMSCTTNATISLEGKNLWLLKMLPVSAAKIFLAKILVNLTISIPTVLIGTLLLRNVLSLDIFGLLILWFTPIMYALFIAGFGLFINLLLPDFEWTNEIKVIKQSMPVYITLMVGMIISITPIIIKFNIKPNLYSLLIGMIMFILVITIYALLFTKGKKIFKAL